MREYKRVTPKTLEETINYNGIMQDITPFLQYAAVLFDLENKIENGTLVFVNQEELE